MRKTIEITCSFCNKKFQKDIREFNRNKKIKRVNFCSLFCVGKASGRWSLKDPFLIRNFKGKRGAIPLDGFSPFRGFLRHLKERCERKERSLKKVVTLDDLKNQWEKQSGICPYTGWKLVLPVSTSSWPKSENLRRASLDRIDYKKGYIKENVQFICKMANWGRHIFSDRDLSIFCRIVRRYQTSQRPLLVENPVIKQENKDFLKYLKYAKKSKKLSTITVRDLKGQWLKQNGRCSVSGIRLKHNTSGKQNPFQASLDRIDSSKGYVAGNIQFICLIANYAKNSYSNEDLIDFCEAVAYNCFQNRR